MDFLLEALTNWLKEMLVGGIMSNLSGMFDSVNQQVADISVQVGQTPQGWNGSIFSMIENLSNSIMVPIAGVILAIVMTVDLIQMIADKNNLHDVDTWMIFKWVFKSAAAILIVTNTWNIVMGVFDMAQSVVAQAAGIINSDASIDISSVMTDLEPRLMEMDLGPLFGLWFQSLFIGITMWALYICIFIVIYGRMIEIYLVTSVAPLPMAAMMGKEWGGMGQNYLRSLLALGFQAFLIIVCVAIYAVLVQNIALEDILYHFDGSGEILETVSLGAKRMTYEQVLCPNDTLLLNNSYLLQQFSLRTHEVTPFANKKNSMKAMLDQSGDLTLWYTGEEIVVFDFGSNTEVWREAVKCKKSKDPNFAYYCFGMLSPRQSKAAYRVTEGEYALVDLKSAQKVVISNAGWHPFFSPDDQCFSVGGKFYLTQTGEEMDNPFPFSVRQGLSFSDTCSVRTRGSLMAVQQDRGSSPIEVWDTGSGQLLATIDDPFVVRQVNFAFTQSGLVLHTDYGAMSIYSCAL